MVGKKIQSKSTNEERGGNSKNGNGDSIVLGKGVIRFYVLKKEG
jgi:hypothetical protein